MWQKLRKDWYAPWRWWGPTGDSEPTWALIDRNDSFVLGVDSVDGTVQIPSAHVRRLVARAPEVLALLDEIAAKGLDAERRARAVALIADIEEGADRKPQGV